jgi:hypothetical protein
MTICVEPLKPKVGTCPVIEDNRVGVCVSLCNGDESCPGSQKCVIMFKLNFVYFHILFKIYF